MLAGRYDPALVLVSICIAVLASYTALAMASRVRHSRGQAAAAWIAAGAFAMGTGIWAMHFVGMLAFELPLAMGYDAPLTLLSWALPVGVSALALWQLGRARPTWARLGLSALLFGLGINLMHYVGMLAMRMDPPIVWDPLLVAASLAIAIAAAAAALGIAFRLRDAGPRVGRRRAVAALAMGGAIVGMHYTGMAAAAFPDGSVCRAAGMGVAGVELAVLVTLATVAILAVALLAAAYDARLAARNRVLAVLQRTAVQRKRLLDSERQARAEAERLGRIKDEFLATLSHELRTPLNAILGWSQLLQRRRDEASLARALESIERNARLQAQLIEDLLDMSRIVSGQLRLQRELLDPAAVVRAALETVGPAALAKGIRLSESLDPACGPLAADPVRLQQVLWNLLSNAVKFTPAGGTVSLWMGCGPGELVLRVSDNGMGIAPGFLPHVFDRFRQADATTTRRHGGLGLGLAIVRQLVELHGGSVEAASDGPGQGATFTVRLPLQPPDLRDTDHPLPRTADRGDPSPAQAPPPCDLGGARVLVVDDDDDARALAGELLRGWGAQVWLADGAEAAWRLLLQQPVDLLVSDLGMPGMDGYALARRLRAHGDARLAALPAIALTAYTRRQDEAQARAAGFSAWLTKPLLAEALHRAACEQLGLAQPG